jgi:TrmH family RNA methyltransferase
VLILDVARATTVILVRPHYPENVGAAARALKTMGLTQLALVKPGRLAFPENEMALKMAVKAWDVLDHARCMDTLDQALEGVDVTFGTTARRGVSGVLVPERAAEKAVEHARAGRRLAFVFGNEKTGLSAEELARCDERLRIPMAAEQPSINLAQAVQLVAYSLFAAGLAERERRRDAPEP